MNKKTKTVIILIALVVLSSVFIYFLLSKPRESKPPESYIYSCYYNEGWNHVRCMNKEDEKMTCYGYYDLLATHPKDGIKIDTSNTGSTCEGFGGNPQYYYDKAGKIIN